MRAEVIMGYFRRLPILTVLVVGVCTLFLFINYDQQKAVLKARYNEVTLDREKTVKEYSILGQNLGAKDHWDELQTSLEAARQSKRLDFYILQYQGRALWSGANDEISDKLEGNYPAGDVITPEVSLTTTAIGAGYKLTIGIQKNLSSYIEANADHLRKVTLEQSYHILFIILLVGLWSLKDLMLVVREVRRGKRGNLRNLKTRSAETQAFVQGLTGYAQAVEVLTAENRKLGRQVLPSLQKEIFSGRKPPYDFHCTMVRTDINHFSTIYNTHNVTELMSTINDYFDEVSRIVARYGGLVHEFVGDEVIYYFKDDDHENSVAIALSALRDINVAAERFDEKTQAERGYPFTVKSSLAHGKVRFGPLVNGFTVAGSVLIETVRILSYIHERNVNVVYFDGIHAKRLEGLIQSGERLRVTLKGFQSEISLRQYESHLDLENVLRDLNDDKVDALLYYRSDEDLAKIILDLRANVAKRSLAVTLRAINGLREPYVADSSLDFGTLISDWLKELSQQFENDSFSGADKVLSAVTKLFMNLVPKATFTQAHRSEVRGLLNCTDRRVVANAVEVLTYFAVEIDGRLIRKLQSNDLRTAANSLILEGSDELTGPVMKKLKAFVNSKSANDVASGLYALGELSYMHRLRDPAYYAGHSELLSLIDKLPLFSQHLSTSVRRQALIAARKSDDSKIIESIRAVAKDSGSELLREELTRFLDASTGAAALRKAV